MAALLLQEELKRAVYAVEPSAEIILYGSRARNGATEDSDWDILVLTPDRPDVSCKRAIRAGLYEIEWNTGEVICAIIKGKNEWCSLQQAPFHRNVQKDGILL